MKFLVPLILVAITFDICFGQAESKKFSFYYGSRETSYNIESGNFIVLPQTTKQALSGGFSMISPINDKFSFVGGLNFHGFNEDFFLNGTLPSFYRPSKFYLYGISLGLDYLLFKKSNFSLEFTGQTSLSINFNRSSTNRIISIAKDGEIINLEYERLFTRPFLLAFDAGLKPKYTLKNDNISFFLHWQYHLGLTKISTSSIQYENTQSGRELLETIITNRGSGATVHLGIIFPINTFKIAK